MNARARGVDVVFIYNVAARSNFGILVKDDSAFMSPADLKGKVVGVGNQAPINNNNPAVTLQVKSKANGQLATGLPVKNSIADN